MVKPLQFSKGGSSNTADYYITAFYRGLTRICTPQQDGHANLETVYTYYKDSCIEWIKDLALKLPGIPRLANSS